MPDNERSLFRLLDPHNRLPARLTADREALARLADGLSDLPGPEIAVRLGELKVLAHRLAGAAGTFGFGGLSSAALTLEDCLVEFRAGQGSSGLPEGLTSAMGTLVAALDAAAEKLQR